MPGLAPGFAGLGSNCATALRPALFAVWPQTLGLRQLRRRTQGHGRIEPDIQRLHDEAGTSGLFGRCCSRLDGSRRLRGARLFAHSLRVALSCTRRRGRGWRTTCNPLLQAAHFRSTRSHRGSVLGRWSAITQLRCCASRRRWCSHDALRRLGRIGQKSVGARGTTCAASRERDQDHRFIDGGERLHPHTGCQGAHQHFGLADQRVTGFDADHHARGGDVRALIRLDIKGQIQRITQHHSAPARAQRKRGGAGGNHPQTGSKNGVTDFHNNFSFWCIPFLHISARLGPQP